MARSRWTQPQKDAFLADQFRLQHHHFITHFPEADFWIVERSPNPSGGRKPWPIGRFYIDRSKPLWRCIDLGFLPDERTRGVGGGLLTWAQHAAHAAGAQGIDLHVMTTNPRAQALYARLRFQVAGEAGAHRHMIWRP